ncbi:cupredoxin family copper-binding protein [Candidatus Woesearchaeota archaeon]|nr:cupredoxin family copper-binding protein [Candidatus Woesearchaeota archaeon]
MKQLFAILGLLLLVACTAPVVEKAPGVLESADHIVTINKFKFSPSSITIKAGETVLWKNQESVSHTVAVDGAESNELFEGDTWSHTFTTAGTFDYVCGIHPSMTGSVMVE